MMYAILLTSFLFVGFINANDTLDNDIIHWYVTIFSVASVDNNDLKEVLASMFHLIPENTKHLKELKEKLREQFTQKYGVEPELVV